MSGLKSQFVEEVNDDKIIVLAKDINKTLNQAIEDGDLSGASLAPETLFYQNFDSSKLADFDQSGAMLETVTPLNGRQSVFIEHDPFLPRHLKEVFPVGRKFNQRLYKLEVSLSTSAIPNNVSIEIKDETHNNVIITEQLASTSSNVSVQSIPFEIPYECSSLSYKVVCLPQAGEPVTEFDDVRIVPIEDKELSPILYQEGDSQVTGEGFAGYGSTATTTIRYSTVSVEGSDINYVASPVHGDRFYLLSDGVYTIGGSVESAANLSSLRLITVLYDANDTQVYFQESRDSQNTASAVQKNVSVSMTVKGKAGQYFVVAANGSGVTLTSAKFNIVKQGSLKQINRVPNQKIKIPTSELRMEGFIGKGSGSETIVVRFNDITKLRGDAFEIDNSNGTHVKIKKAGKLSVDASLYLNNAGQSFAISKNQTNRTVMPSQAEVVAVTAIGTSAAQDSISGTTLVEAGDIIRVCSTINSTGLTAFNLTFQEQEIQVSAPDALPQFSEHDTYLLASGNAGTAVTISVTNIPFTGVEQNNTGGQWNGSQFTIDDDSIYTISCNVQFTTSADRGLELFVNGAPYRRLGQTQSGYANVKGDYTGRFLKGQVLSIRAHSNGGTLNNTPVSHYLSIVKIGKPNITGIDVNPFVNIPSEMHQKSFLERIPPLAAPQVGLTGSVTTMDGSGIFSYDPVTGIYTTLKKATFNMSLRWTSVTAVEAAGVIEVNSILRALGHSRASINDAGSCNYSDVLSPGDTFRFRTSNQEIQSIQAVVVAKTTIDTIAVADTGKVGELIWSLNPSDPVGFVSAANKTIGKESSGADYEGQKYFTLYSTVWAAAGTSTVSTDPFSISSAKGASAQADWDSNKLIRINFESNEVFVRQKGTSRDLGSYQGDAIRNITGTIGDFAGVSGNGWSHQSGVFTGLNVGNADVAGAQTGSTNANSRVSFNASNVVPTAAENRPKNVALNAYIRYSGELNLYVDTRPARYIVKTFQSGSDWYEVNNDGWVRQGYYRNNLAGNITLLIPYRDNNYTITNTGVSTNTSGATYNWIGITGFTSTTISINANATVQRHVITEGYGNSIAVKALGATPTY